MHILVRCTQLTTALLELLHVFGSARLMSMKSISAQGCEIDCALTCNWIWHELDLQIDWQQVVISTDHYTPCSP